MGRRPTFILAAAAACICALAPLKAEDLDKDSVQGAVFFDGAVNKNKPLRQAPAPAAHDRAQLADALKQCLILNDHGNPAERAALDSMISRMLDSPTASEAAAEFIKAGARAELSYEDLPCTPVTVNGKKTFWGTSGSTLIDKKPPVVMLNKFFMHDSADEGIGTLAHEMLGHVLERKLIGPLCDLALNDEENAHLIGWLARTELGVTPEDDLLAYVENPGDYIGSMIMSDASNAKLLTTAEMKNPAPVYLRRIKDADRILKQLQENAGMYRQFGKNIDHFITAHKMPPGPFRTIKEELANRLNDLPANQKDLARIKGTLQDRLIYFLDKDGRQFLMRLAKQADNNYFKHQDSVVRERRMKLEGLLRGRLRTGLNPPPAEEQLSFDQLKELIAKDSECPFGSVK